MRRALVLGLSAIVIVGSVAPSEARFRFRLGGSPAPIRAPAAAPGLGVMPGFSLRGDHARAGLAGAAIARASSSAMSADASARGVESTVPIAAAIPVAAPVPVVQKEPTPWCASGRVAGSGAGFCLIN